MSNQHSPFTASDYAQNKEALRGKKVSTKKQNKKILKIQQKIHLQKYFYSKIVQEYF